MYTKLTAALALLISQPVLPADKADYANFFTEYQHLSSEFDTSVSSMYADDAKIMGARIKADGTDERMTITGARWKSIILASMEGARELNDLYEYSDTKIQVDTNQATISAIRYSTASCFTDNNFYMIVKSKVDGQLQITEQFMQSPARSNCEDSDTSLQEYLQNTVKMINEQLPASIDSETQLIKTSAEGNNLIYHYVLLNHTSKTLTKDEATSRLQPLILQQSCANPNLQPILDQDGSISYIYRGSDAVQIAKLDINKTACSK